MTFGGSNIRQNQDSSHVPLWYDNVQEMVDRLIEGLVETKNEAADELLTEALRLGTETEQTAVLAAVLRRQSVKGLSGVIGLYDSLPQPLQVEVLGQIKLFHHALR